MTARRARGQAGVRARRETARPALRVPRRWSIPPRVVIALLVLNGAMVLGIWLRHDWLAHVRTIDGILTTIGQVAALEGAYLALVGLLLMSRSPWLDRSIGPDRLARWHRLTGFVTVWLLILHVSTTTIGYALADALDPISEGLLLLDIWDVLLAAIAFCLFLVIAVTSIRLARRKLSREAWYGLHLYGYLAVALAFFHQLSVGLDFRDDRLAVAYWVALYVVAFGSLLAFRWIWPFRLTRRHRPVVARVVAESPDTISVYVTGRDLHRIPVRAGQSFQVRFLAGAGWWRPHPFSISAAPDGRTLRFTIKDLGDDTRRMARLAPGTRVFLEGPYGAFTADSVGDRGLLLVAGGIGITPLRAIMEEMPPGNGRCVLVYRARTPDDVVFRTELDDLARTRGALVHYLVGKRGATGMSRDPLSPSSLERLVPDAVTREAFVCGPDALMARTITSLRALGLPEERIHAERFAT